METEQLQEPPTVEVTVTEVPPENSIPQQSPSFDNLSSDQIKAIVLSTLDQKMTDMSTALKAEQAAEQALSLIATTSEQLSILTNRIDELITLLTTESVLGAQLNTLHEEQANEGRDQSSSTTTRPPMWL